MENEFIYRYYSHPLNPNRVSVVGKFTDNQLKVSASRCSTSDNFKKSTGRQLAEDRLNSGNHIAIFPMKECSIKRFRDIAGHIAYLVMIHPDIITQKEEIKKEAA